MLAAELAAAAAAQVVAEGEAAESKAKHRDATGKHKAAESERAKHAMVCGPAIFPGTFSPVSAL